MARLKNAGTELACPAVQGSEPRTRWQRLRDQVLNVLLNVLLLAACFLAAVTSFVLFPVWAPIAIVVGELVRRKQARSITLANR